MIRFSAVQVVFISSTSKGSNSWEQPSAWTELSTYEKNKIISVHFSQPVLALVFGDFRFLFVLFHHWNGNSNIIHVPTSTQLHYFKKLATTPFPSKSTRLHIKPYVQGPCAHVYRIVQVEPVKVHLAVLLTGYAPTCRHSRRPHPRQVRLSKSCDSATMAKRWDKSPRPKLLLANLRK